MRLGKFFILLIALVCTVSAFTFSASAQWFYHDPTIMFNQDVDTNVNLVEFEYTPDEVLPGGSANDQEVIVGNNHMMLIKNIVDHVTYGLNATSKPIVRELLEKGANVVYSNQSVSGGNLKHMLLNDSSMEALDFAVKYETSSFYTAYTFASKYLSSSYIGTTIEVYKTDLVYENGKWVAKRSYLGTAKVARVTGGNKQIVNIDVSTWVETRTTTPTSVN